MDCKGRMSFRDFVFPANPSVIRVTHKRRLSRREVPFGKEIVTDMGSTERVISGEGEFFGQGAQEDFDRLKAAFEQRGAGVLYVPSQGPMSACFEKLELQGKDVEGVIGYSFTFRECTGTEHRPGGIIADGSHCLWDYAYLYGRDIMELIRLNPGIKRPDTRINAGEELRLC